MSRTKLDKIFDNKFHESDYSADDATVDFQSEPFAEDFVNPHRALLVESIIKQIDDIVETHFHEFKVVTDNKTKRVNKDAANKIYSIVRNLIKDDFTIIDIWYYVARYFDIDTNRFFDSLDDKFKNELIMALKLNTELLNDEDTIHDIF